MREIEPRSVGQMGNIGTLLQATVLGLSLSLMPSATLADEGAISGTAAVFRDLEQDEQRPKPRWQVLQSDNLCRTEKTNTPAGPKSFASALQSQGVPLMWTQRSKTCSIGWQTKPAASTRTPMGS